MQEKSCRWCRFDFYKTAYYFHMGKINSQKRVSVD